MSIVDLPHLQGQVIRHEAQIDQLYKELKSIRLGIGQGFRDLNSRLDRIGKAHDDDSTDVRVLKAMVRSSEKRKAFWGKVLIAISGPVALEILHRVFHF